MTIAAFITHLETLGVVLTAEGDRLRCSAPKQALTPALRDEIGRRKAEIIAALTLRAARPDPLAVHRVDRGAPIPLAMSQERIWFLHQLEPESSAYTIAVAARLTGQISREALQRACDEIVRRHEVLRTCYPVVDGRPVQRVKPASPVAIEPLDLTEVAAADRVPAYQARAAAIVERPFDLERGPVFRTALLTTAADDHVFVLAVHHIAFDQWSLGILGGELAELYQAASSGRPSRLTELAMQFADYAGSHAAWLTPDRAALQLEYWKEQLAGLRPAELPADRPRTGLPGTGANRTIDLEPDVLTPLRRLAAQEHATLFMVLLAAFKVVMSRYTGQTDLAVGTPIANRTVPEVEPLVGTFVNTLVFRTDLSGDPTFVELLGRVRETALGAFAHQDIPFDRLVNALRPQRDTRQSPLFQVLFNVQNSPFKAIRLPDLEFSILPLTRHATQFDLTISIDAEVDHRLSYSYSESLFDAETVTRLFEHYLRVLRAVGRNPQVRLSAVELLSDTERLTLLERWNDTARDFPLHETIVSLFERQVQSAPDVTAVICGSASLSYAELDRRSSVLAAHLASLGAGPEVLVGVCLERSVDLVVALMAVLKAGAAYVPLDPAFPADRLRFMVDDSGAALLLTQEALLPLLQPTSASIHCLDRDAGTVRSEVLARSRTSSEALAYVLYTSGSTGRPKGVAIGHRALTNFLLSMQEAPGIAPGDRLLSVTTLSFDIAGLELYLPLITGAQVVLATKGEAIDPAALSTLMEAHDITMMQATPATWRMLIEHGWAGRSRLTVLCGGEVMSRELADRLMARAGTVWNMYGPTETTVWSTVERIVGGEGPITIGRPIANTQTYVLDAFLRPAPIGVPGELYIGGDGLARGYLGRPELTASRFVPDPFARDASDGAPAGQLPRCLYRTGDLARVRADGRLECLGRIDHQVKIRGFRIELGEIESVLAGDASVAHAVVSVHHDAQGEPHLVAYLTPAGSTVDMDRLKRAAAEQLPRYMVPGFFVELAAMPMTPNGKVDRKALPPPVVASGRTRSSTAAPRSRAESTLAAIWGDCLGLSDVGVEEDFFELGGHSLLAVRVMSRVEEAFNRRVGVALLFEARTIRQLARALDDGQPWRSRWQSLVHLQSEGHKPPFFCVHSVGGEVHSYAALAARLAPDQPFVALQAPGYDGRSDPFATIEEQASYYVQQVIKYQPLGPYYLGGHSHGGRVALEMALQLEALHRRVAFLGILDTTPEAVPQPAHVY